jgi:hypothetical protein
VTDLERIGVKHEQKITSEPETGSARATRVGDVQRRYQEIRLADPRQHASVEAMEQLRVSSIGRAPGAPTRGLMIIQPSGSGKSESAKQFKAFVEGQPGRDPSLTPVLHVTLETVGTPKSAIVSCLEALGDEYAMDGSEPLLLKRLKKAIEKEGVEIMIIDELNHCSQKVMGKDVSNTLKNMLTRGWAPLILMGTSDASRLFKGNRELRNRCHPQLSLAPFDPEVDIDAWRAFLEGMDEQIVSRELLSDSSNLGNADVAKALCIACGGLIGEVCLVIEDALCAVVRRRDRSIGVNDLHHAINVRYVLTGDLAANPLQDFF